MTESKKEINRELFLSQLESTGPALSVKEVVEQSSCFVFRKGRVFTFNDEMACSCRCELKGVEVAVQGRPLIDILRKLPEERIGIEIGDGKFIVKGKRRKASIRMEEEILMGIEAVNIPKAKSSSWKELPVEFCDAVESVCPCASKNESTFSLTCVHVSPKWIEACDNFQISRYPLKTGLKGSLLVRHEAIRHVGESVMNKWAVDNGWIHFRNDEKLTISCRQYLEEFPDLTHLIKTSGDSITLPKSLTEASSRAEIFTVGNETDDIQISLMSGKIKVSGEGSGGTFTEILKTDYSGESFKFTISPKILSKIVTQHHDCEINETALKASGGKFTYVTSLGEVDNE